MRGLVEWFLGNRGASLGPFDRRRLLVQGSLAAGLVSAGLASHRFVLEPDIGLKHANVVFATLLIFACPFVFRFTGSLRAAAHLLLGGLTAVVTIDSVLYGGLGSPPTTAFMIVPLMGVFFLGVREGAAHAATTALAMGLLFANEVTGTFLFPRPPREQLIQMQLVAGLGILGFVATLAGFYELERDAAMTRARTIVDNLVDGVIAVDRAGRVVMANPAARRLVGVVQGQPALSGTLATLAAQVLETGEDDASQIDLPGDGVGAVAASVIDLEGGMRAGAVLIVRDITVEASVDRMKTDFIATVSHEMRTPLTSVLGFAKLIRSKLEADVFPRVPEGDKKADRTMKKVWGNLGIIIEEGERLTHLIGDVLDIAKLESGQMEWHMEDVDVGEVATRAIDATQGLFMDRDVALVGDITEDLPHVHGDAQRLLQVLINLISNASKFTDEGTVTLRVRAEGGRVDLRVIDTGAGIDAEDREKIFDRFRQAGDTLLDRPRGTGLGLPICVEIVQAHHGTIRVESAVGEGSTFIVDLPAVVPTD